MIDEIATDVKRKRCILFLGAAAHSPPPGNQGTAPYSYPPESRPPSAWALAERLAQNCELLSKYPDERRNLGNLGRVATFYEMIRGRTKLIDEIVSAVDREVDDENNVVRETQPSPAIRALAELPFSLIITTNYDHLFERALRRAGKEPVVGVYDPMGNDSTKDLIDIPDVSRPFVYKLHGDINTRDSVVISDEDYIQFVLRMGDRDRFHPVPEIFRVQFKRWPTLFVGYSLLDYNLRLLFRTLRWKLDEACYPKMYSVDYKPDPVIEHFYGGGDNPYVWFLVQNLWEFVPDLYRRVTGKEMPE